MKSWLSTDPSDLDQIAREILEQCGANKVLCFHGELGAGKTTLIKAICRQLGVVEEVQSPTFSIVNEYESAGKTPIYHFDFYRLKSEEEAYDLGYEDYLFSGYFCFIEWPEKIAGLLDMPKTDVRILTMDNHRHISLENG